MTQQHIQASFNSGEWSPKLYGRVDLQKYRSGAALLQNFFVDYRGGASTRPGTKYVLQCFKSDTSVRLIPFQASFSVGYVLEFGDRYVRFFYLGAPVLEAATSITVATAGPPEVFIDTAHGYANGDWIFAGNAYYIVQGVTANTFTLTDLFGNAINTNPFTLPANAQRVYTIASPYLAADLSEIKFAQNVNELILCHPNYAPQVLTLVTATDWTLLPITIGTTAVAPATPTITSQFTGSPTADAYYSYVVTSVNSAGQESNASTAGGIGPIGDIRTAAGTISIAWTAEPGAVSYNIYKTNISYFGPLPAGSIYGYIGSTTGVSFIDDNISADFSQTPPIATNPFLGGGIASVTVTAAGTYILVPSVTFTGASSTMPASASAVLQVQGTPTVAAGGSLYSIGDVVTFSNGVSLVVASVGLGFHPVTAWESITTSGSNPGSVSGVGNNTPTNPVVQVSTSGSGTGATTNLVWGIGSVIIISPGSNYASVPTVAFSA